jgi:hypothetical protein
MPSADTARVHRPAASYVHEVVRVDDRGNEGRRDRRIGTVTGPIWMEMHPQSMQR